MIKYIFSDILIYILNLNISIILMSAYLNYNYFKVLFYKKFF